MVQYGQQTKHLSWWLVLHNPNPKLQNLLVTLSRKKLSVLLCSLQPKAHFPALVLLTSSTDILMEIKWPWMTIRSLGHSLPK